MFDSLNIDEQYGYLLAKSEPAYRLPQNSAFENVLGVLFNEGRIEKRGAYYYFKKEKEVVIETLLPKEFTDAFQRFLGKAEKVNKGTVKFKSFVNKFEVAIQLRTCLPADLVKFYLLCTAIKDENYGLNMTINPSFSEVETAKKIFKLADLETVLKAIFNFVDKGNYGIFKLYMEFNKFAEFEKRGGW